MFSAYITTNERVSLYLIMCKPQAYVLWAVTGLTFLVGTASYVAT